MKYILIVFLMATPCWGHCQFFVGDSKISVQAILDNSKIRYSEEIITDSTYRISWMADNLYQMIILFNRHDTVIRQTLIPEAENGVNNLVKWFNKEFVVVSDTEWKNYANGRIYRIQLEYILREPFFSITLVKEGN